MAKEDTKEKNRAETAAPAPAANIQAATAGAPADGGESSEGVRARRALMLKQFIPNPEWITREVVLPGKGTRRLVGRIFGAATGVEKKQNTLPDGKVVDSIAVRGVFQTESYLTGEVSQASMVFFPMAYAEQVAFAFTDETVKVVELDTDVGLEATGKSIPYEWVVVAHIEGKEMDVLKRLRAARGRPKEAPAMLAAPAQKALPAA